MSGQPGQIEVVQPVTDFDQCDSPAEKNLPQGVLTRAQPLHAITEFVREPRPTTAPTGVQLPKFTHPCVA